MKSITMTFDNLGAELLTATNANGTALTAKELRFAAESLANLANSIADKELALTLVPQELYYYRGRRGVCYALFIKLNDSGYPLIAAADRFGTQVGQETEFLLPVSRLTHVKR